MLQIAKECLISRQIDPNKTVTLTQKTQIPNSVVLRCIYFAGDGWIKIRDFQAGGQISTQFLSGTGGGTLWILCQLDSRESWHNEDWTKFKYNIGTNAGDKEHEPFANPEALATQIQISLLGGTNHKVSNISSVGQGNWSNLPIFPVINSKIESIQSVIDQQKQRNTDFLQIEVVLSNTGIPLIEESVNIHLFDANGNLKGNIRKNYDTGQFENTNIVIDKTQIVQFLPLVRIANPDNKQPENEYKFEIGDPKTDADIEITEE